MGNFNFDCNKENDKIDKHFDDIWLILHDIN